MFGKKIRLGLAVMAALLCTSGSLAKASEVENSGAAEEPGEVIMISDVEGLMAMERDPEGNYALACDVDAAGADWFPFAFHGSLEGNGYSICSKSSDGGATAVPNSAASASILPSKDRKFQY